MGTIIIASYWGYNLFLIKKIPIYSVKRCNNAVLYSSGAHNAPQRYKKNSTFKTGAYEFAGYSFKLRYRSPLFCRDATDWWNFDFL